MKRRGSHSAISISSSEDSGLRDFGRSSDEGEGENVAHRPIAKFSPPLDHMEVVRETRHESYASMNDGAMQVGEGDVHDGAGELKQGGIGEHCGVGRSFRTTSNT